VAVPEAANPSTAKRDSSIDEERSVM